MPKPRRVKDIRCALHSIGFLLLAHPDAVDTWSLTIGHSGGKNVPFTNIELNTQGRIMLSIPAGKGNLEDSATRLRTFSYLSHGQTLESTVVETVMADICFSNPLLDTVLSGEVPLIRNRPREINLDSSGEDILGDFMKQLRDSFVNDLTWPSIAGAAGRYSYSLAYATIVVNDLDRFHSAMTHAKPPLGGASQSVTFDRLLPKRLAVLRFGSPMDTLKVPYFYIRENPIHIFAVDGCRILDWLDRGFSFDVDKDDLSPAVEHRKYLLHLNRLRLVDRQIGFLESRCTDLLESLPESSPESYSQWQEHMERILDTSKDLAFYRSSHLLTKDFVVREEPRNVESDYYGEPQLEISRIEERLNILGERLLLLEQSLQTRLTLDNIVVEHYRANQQNKMELLFSRLTLWFGSFIVFEVLGSFLAWYLTPGDSIAIISWIILIFSPVVLTLFAMQAFQKLALGNKDGYIKERTGDLAPVESSYLCCPHCGASYYYRIASGTSVVACQNCAKTF